MVATIKSIRSSGCFGTPDMSVVSNLWVSCIIDAHRFRSTSESVLARYETVGSEGAFFPDADELTELGVNVHTLATCLDAESIKPELVEELLGDLNDGHIDAEQFNDAVALTLVPRGSTLSPQDALTFASHLPDVLEAARIHPNDQVDRALHGKGLCSCHVEFTA